MIFCHKCKVEEMIDDYYSDEWKCPKCNQPERSKREDLIVIGNANNLPKMEFDKDLLTKYNWDAVL